MSQDFGFLDPAMTQQRMAKIREIQEATASVVGRASSEDELIKVSYTEAEGVQKFELDPAALRMPPEDLADELARLVNEARKDAQQQIQRLAQSAAPDTKVDPQALMSQMPEIERNIGDLMKETQTMTSQLMGLVERMRINTQPPNAPKPKSERDDD